MRRAALLSWLALVACAPPLVPQDSHQEAAATLAAPPPAEDAAHPAGENDAAWDDDASLPAHAEDVVDYTLTATLDPAAHTVHGEGTITLRNTSRAPLTELWLHLYLNAFKNEKSAFLSEPVGHGGRGIEPIKDWGSIDVRKLTLREASGADLWAKAELHRPDSDDETDARVPLPRVVAPGETIHLDVAWDDKLPSVVERTGYDGSFHMVAQWFPKLARLEPDGTWAHFPFHHLAEFYADFGTYDVTLDVPAAFQIGATGPAVETRIDRGLRRIERHVQKDVHDFAWTAWDQWQTAGEAIDGVVVTLLYPPGYRRVAERELATMRFALPHYREKYGRYPYAVLTLVHPPDTAREAGGMEYPTLITTGGPWWTPPEILGIELVTIHEFGHQYFYGMVATDEVHFPFLDEGLNSYAEAEGLGAWRGEGSVASLTGLTFSDTSLQTVTGNEAAHDEPVAQPAYAFDTGGRYGALVYERTGEIVETLRRVYGDALVSRALGRYTRKNRFHHPRPEDLVASFREVVGPAAAENLRAALFDKAWVDYVVSGIESHPKTGVAGLFDRGGRRETQARGLGDGTYEGWVLVTRRGNLSFPVEIELTLEGGEKQRLTWDGQGDSARLPYAGKAAIEAVEIDPDHRVLLDEKPMNNFARRNPGERASVARTTERTSYWAELALELLGP